MNQSFVWGGMVYFFRSYVLLCLLFGSWLCKAFAKPWLGGEGEKAITNILWPGFEAAWPLLVTPDNEQFPVSSP